MIFKKSKIIKTVTVVLSATTLGLFGTANYYATNIPDSFYVNSNETLSISSYPELTETIIGGATSVSSLSTPTTQEVSLKLFGVVPVKTVEVQKTEAPTLIAGGSPFGIKLLMDGVMVIEVKNIESNGKTVSPAKSAAITEGDIIRSINGSPVSSNKDIQKIIGDSKGSQLEVILIREGVEIKTHLTPVWSTENRTYLAGMVVRDSIAGIGTMTFINKETGNFAGLGHPICDSDTGEIIPISSGKAVPVEITDVIKGRKGVPGELNGCFTPAQDIGDLVLNNRCGIFGTLTEDALSNISGDEYKMAYKQEIEEGDAYILCTTSGCESIKYEIEIESINYTGDDNTKNMIISITDEELIAETGGIVQGMSGSPIIQNDKIIGAVTHVFIADSTKGYGIFAENMVEHLAF